MLVAMIWLALSPPAHALVRAPDAALVTEAEVRSAVLGDRARCHAFGEAALDRGDYAEAWAWFALHAEGDRFLQDHLRMMWPVMTPERLSAAARLQATWQLALEPAQLGWASLRPSQPGT